jgi:hypothetical protein
MVLGAAAGLGMIAAVHGASGLIVEAVAYFSSPILVAIFLIGLSQTAAQATLTIGSMLLYAAYAFVVFDRRGWRLRPLWLMAIVTIHGACLAAWVGLIMSAIVRAVP